MHFHIIGLLSRPPSLERSEGCSLSQSGGSLEPRLGFEARSGGRFDVRAEREGRHNNNITHDLGLQ